MTTAAGETTRKQSAIGAGEFIALMAAMTSLAALSTDAMLPALSTIGLDLHSPDANANQLIVTFLFFGMAVGQFVFGPLSDSTGRKPSIYLGYAVFGAGSLLTIFAGSFNVMLAGRLLQGFGIAGPRGVTMALVRDRFSGREMARVMSFVMMVFIIAPIIAPSIGQLIFIAAGWRAIFVFLLIMAAVTCIWFALRQNETLPPERRMPFSFSRILRAFQEVLRNRITLGYTLSAGLISGAFLGYLNSSQQIFQVQYGLGGRFPLFFAAMALSMGTASFLNSRLVMRYGMRRMAHTAAIVQSALSIPFLILTFTMQGHPPLALFTLYLAATLFCTGILFGNQNALAMEPLGHVAGVGSAVVGALSLLLGTPLGMVIGQSYNDTVLPVVTGFALLGTAAIVLMRWAERGQTKSGA
ncbi:MAG: multidrug effflux MFS transporter [Caldilineaceae bacterium]|nr:multidrug effflux MFS transporter [Caldilineaceae bacterium]